MTTRNRTTTKGSRQIPYQLTATTPGDIAAIHAATLSILAETGAYYEDPEAIRLLVRAGASAGADGRVRIPVSLVEKAIRTAPRSIRMYTRLGEEALKLEAGYVYYGTGSDCPNVLDFDSGERRLAVKQDIETFARLSDALPEIDFVLSMAIASDVPTATADLHHFQAMLYNTTKPVFYTVVNEENNARIISFAALAAGGLDALRERPFIAHFGMPSPPLRHSRPALRNLVSCAQQSIPVVYASGTQMGTSGPMTIAGATVASNCDVLSGLVVHQLANPGAPFIYGACIAPIDMRTTIECYGAPEHYLGDLLNVRVAQHYGLPTWGYAGDTDSKTLDLQASMEYMGSSVMGLLSGCNLLHDVGYLESGMLASCESIVFGNEVAACARRMIQPVLVNPETLAAEVIKRVGPGGTYLTEEHTLSHFREFWYSPLIDRSRYEGWVEKGSLSMSERVRNKTAELLASHHPPALDEVVRQAIDAQIAALDRDELRVG